MLKTFGITNFKVFGEKQKFELAPITLIYGPNSGGKSSIIQALLLLKQSIEAPMNQGIRDRVLIPKGLDVDLGQSKSIHHKHSFDNPISFEVGLSIPQALAKVHASAFETNDEITTTLRFEQRQESARAKLPTLAQITYCALREGRQSLNLTLARGSKPIKSPTGDELDLEDTSELDKPLCFFSFQKMDEIRSFNEFLKLAPTSKYEANPGNSFGLENTTEEKHKNRYQVGFRPSASGKTNYLPATVRNLAKREGFQSIIDSPSRVMSQIARVFNLHFESMSYLGPLRSRPKRLYELSQQYHGSIGSSGEYAVEALKTDMHMDSAEEESVIEFVNSWLATFEIPYTVAVEEIGDEVLGDLAMLKLKDNRTGIWVSATDVGFGIGQLLPVIIEGALAVRANNSTGREKTICVEQPEIHLHPRLQANVADFLIATANLNSCQWVIETHSEALILRVQKRIREGKLLAKNVSVVFVEPTGESGSRILNIRLDEHGNFLDEWPGGFFEETFSEMFF
jgi:predicted ATPase